MGMQAVTALSERNWLRASVEALDAPPTPILYFSLLHSFSSFCWHMDHHRLLNPNLYPNVEPSEPGDGRFPQWSQAETRELLAVRSELDRAFMETKRNKPLWEAVAARMQMKGFARTPEQCKSKWKNLVTRFKGSEGMEDVDRQFPFHAEMQTIYAARQSQEVSGAGEEETIAGSKKKRRTSGNSGEEELEAFLRELLRQQSEMEARLAAEMEAREVERRLKEEEWRRTMEALLEQRAEMERQWRERESERRSREEARAERRLALLTEIINRLTRDDDQ